HPLAVSTPVASIWVDPSELDELTTAQIKQMAKILAMPLSELNQKLNQKNKTFVYLRRAVSPEQAQQIKALAIDGIYSVQEFKRFYPNGEVAAHVVGFTNIDDQGSEGIEYARDKNLVGTNGQQQILRDRQGRVIDNLANSQPAVNGQNIQLSIDNRIQYIAYNALKKQVAKYQAKGGSAVVLDAKTGEVLSMVNMPTYNPNNREQAYLDMLRNRAAIDLYEPGSTMKPFIVAKALDAGLVTPETVFPTMPYKIGPKLIRDTHDHPTLTVSKILEVSSDVGVSKIAAKLTPQQLWNYDTQVGFGQKVGTSFPGEARGILLPWQKWHPLDQASMSYGYAISVSLMQMARAYTIFTNNGCLLPVSFYPVTGNNLSCNPVISAKTAATMRTILSKVTADGTGKLAQLDGYTTAGKTGTAHKASSHGYHANRYVGSFVGFAPANNPKVIIAVMIDEPKGEYYGGV
ncbi:MAG: peptidoglycan D,D-transpeptidase FtsI family protein, partial [Burkholderiales bacterium]